MKDAMTTLHVKKYQNRKLYVVETSSYVSMLELSDLVAEGNRALVTSDLDGSDVTLETLARALYERMKARDATKPAPSIAKLEKIISEIVRS